MSNTKKQYPEQATPITYGQMLGGAVVTPYVQGQQVAATYGANGIGTQQSGTVSVPVSAPTVTYSGNIDTGSGTQGVATPTTPTQVPLYQQHAEEQRQMAYDTAAQSRQNALTQNAATYQQGLSTYGARADSLGRMGLAGSGYADYLSGQAYVAKVNADSAARAVEAQAQQQAQATYAQNLDRGRQQAEAQLLDAINMGATPSQVKQLADSLGMSDSTYVQMGIDSYNNMLKDSVGVGTTYAAIDALDTDIDTKNALKAQVDELNNTTLNEIFSVTTKEDGTAATGQDYRDTILAAKASGTLGQGGVQAGFYKSFIDEIGGKHSNVGDWTLDEVAKFGEEIVKAAQNGNMSQADKEAALTYLYSTAGGVSDTTATVHKGTTSEDGLFDDLIGQHLISEKSIKSANEGENMSRVLTYIAKTKGDEHPKNGTVVSLGDDYYVFHNGGWRYIKNPNDDVKSMVTRSTPKAADHQK